MYSVNYLQIELGKNQNCNGVLSFEVPDHIEVLSTANDYSISRSTNLIEFPLQNLSHISIPFVARDRTEGAIRCSVYDMYSEHNISLIEEKIHV